MVVAGRDWTAMIQLQRGHLAPAQQLAGQEGWRREQDELTRRPPLARPNQLALVAREPEHEAGGRLGGPRYRLRRLVLLPRIAVQDRQLCPVPIQGPVIATSQKTMEQ
jgi:hypothetical protein